MRFAQPPRLLAVLCASILLILLNFRYVHPERALQQKAVSPLSAQAMEAEIAETGPEAVSPEPSASSTPLPVPALDIATPQAAASEPTSARPIHPTFQPIPASEDLIPTLQPSPVLEEPPLSVEQASPEILEEAQDLARNEHVLPGLERLIQEVAGGQPDSVRGVYVEGIMALSVVQQPGGDVGFVSFEEGTATQFQSPIRYDIIGLLAHNFLSGRLFYHLNAGQEIVLVFGNGSLRRYRVTDIADFERLTRANLRSNFLDLETASVVTADQVFQRFYNGEHHLTLQTCIEKDGVWNWGVRFIIAEPLEN